MSKQPSAPSRKAGMQWLVALVVAFATLAGPPVARADAGGDTQLTVQGAPSDEGPDDAGQSRTAVASGGTPKTGDATTGVSAAVVVAGACLVLGGKAMRRRRDAALPLIARGEASPARRSPGGRS